MPNRVVVQKLQINEVIILLIKEMRIKIISPNCNERGVDDDIRDIFMQGIKNEIIKNRTNVDMENN